MGGVMMFFDRAMYVCVRMYANILLTCVQAGHGQRTLPTSPIPSLSVSNAPRTDTFHYRSHAYHRNNQDGRLLRPQAKVERHSRIRRRHIAHPHALGIHRLHRRVIRYPRFVWRLSRNYCGLREQYTHHWAIHCKGSAGNKRRNKKF